MQKALADIQNHLRQRLTRARWTRPEGTHLTLKFLGEVEAEVIHNVAAVLDDITTGYAPFDLALQSVGAFPRLAFPRVLWVGVQRNDKLVKLHQQIEAAISPMGFPAEKRPFYGHLTLARLKGDAWPEDIRQYFLESSSILDGKILPIDQVTLYRSELEPGGAIYTPLHSSPLTGT